MENISKTQGSNIGGLGSADDQIILQGLLDLGRPAVRGFHELSFGFPGKGIRTIRVPKRKRGTFGNRAIERDESVGIVDQWEGGLSKHRLKNKEGKDELSKKRSRLLGSASGFDFDDQTEVNLVDQLSNDNHGEGSLEEGNVFRDNHRAEFGGNHEDEYKITVHHLLIGASDHHFYNEACRNKYSKLGGIKILSEKKLTSGLWIQEFLYYMKDHNLWQACSAFNRSNKQLTLEFYANLMKGNKIASSEWYGLVYVRGVLVRFSPTVINNCLGSVVPESCPNSAYPEGFKVSNDTMAKALSGGVIETWGKNSSFPVPMLSKKFFCLYRVVSGCWIMSSNTCRATSEMAKLMYCIDNNLPFNLGKIIYDRIWGCLENTRGNEKLLHPSLITSIINHASIQDSELDYVRDCGNIIIKGSVTERADDLPGHGNVQDVMEDGTPALRRNFDGGLELNLNEEPGPEEQVVGVDSGQDRLAVVDRLIGDLQAQVDALQDQLRVLQEERNGLVVAGTRTAENGAGDDSLFDLNATYSEAFTELRF